MGAIEKYNADAQVIACGINYDNGHKFRSTVVLEFGVPYKMHELEVKKYKDPEQKKAMVNDFLLLISRGISPSKPIARRENHGGQSR